MQKNIEQLKILYKQLLELSSQIENMVKQENFQEAILLANQKDELINRCSLAKKSMKLSEEEMIDLKNFEDEILVKETANINFMREIHRKMKSKILDVNKKLKVNTAYSIDEKKSGSIVDYSE